MVTQIISTTGCDKIERPSKLPCSSAKSLTVTRASRSSSCWRRIILRGWNHHPSNGKWCHVGQTEASFALWELGGNPDLQERTTSNDPTEVGGEATTTRPWWTVEDGSGRGDRRVRQEGRRITEDSSQPSNLPCSACAPGTRHAVSRCAGGGRPHPGACCHDRDQVNLPNPASGTCTSTRASGRTRRGSRGRSGASCRPAAAGGGDAGCGG
jgi:hypothetical protein